LSRLQLISGPFDDLSFPRHSPPFALSPILFRRLLLGRRLLCFACDGKKDAGDKTEPRDTKKWAWYRKKIFAGFDSWFFSFFVLDEDDFTVAKHQIGILEDVTMYAFGYYKGGKEMPICNKTPPSYVVFPWKKG